ncbi:MAG: hypothetical protein P8176_02065, partial [Gammaproteobacteria bacterium]
MNSSAQRVIAHQQAQPHCTHTKTTPSASGFKLIGALICVGLCALGVHDITQQTPLGPLLPLPHFAVPDSPTSVAPPIHLTQNLSAA